MGFQIRFASYSLGSIRRVRLGSSFAPLKSCFQERSDRVSHHKCIDGFPHSSHQLGAIIVKKLVGHTGFWWSFHMIGRKKEVSWVCIKSVLREKLIPPFCQAL